jgi:hypothetical protein
MRKTDGRGSTEAVVDCSTRASGEGEERNGIEPRLLDGKGRNVSLEKEERTSRTHHWEPKRCGNVGLRIIVFVPYCKKHGADKRNNGSVGSGPDEDRDEASKEVAGKDVVVGEIGDARVDAPSACKGYGDVGDRGCPQPECGCVGKGKSDHGGFVVQLW